MNLPQVFVVLTYWLLSLHPLCGGGDLLFLLSPPAAAAATCFCSHLKTPTRIISKYLQYAYWPWGICLVIFQFLQQNPRWPPKSYGARYSLNRFIDLFHVWFKGKTLPLP